MLERQRKVVEKLCVGGLLVSFVVMVFVRGKKAWFDLGRLDEVKGIRLFGMYYIDMAEIL